MNSVSPDKTRSLIFTVLFTAVMLGVLFGILTDSRNSILIKEMVYVLGGAVASFIAGFYLLMGKPSAISRIPRFIPAILGSIVLFAVFRHYTGIQSVNGPFTLMMLLSLSLLSFTTVLFISQEGVRIFTGIFLAASALVFVYAILQWQGINVFQWDAGLTRSGRSTGSLGNPNLLGGFASAVIPLGVTWLLTMKSRTPPVRKVLAGIFSLLTIFAIIASGTRGSLLGTLAGCGFMAIWYIRRSDTSWRQWAPALLVVGVIVAAVALPMSSRLSELDPEARNQGTLQVRKLIWSGAFSLFLDNPVLGHGPGSFQILYPQHRDPAYNILGVSHNTLHAHCEYLEILVDVGLVGLLLWGVFVVLASKRIKNAGPLAAAGFAGIVAMLAEASVSVHLRWPPTAWLFAMFFVIYLVRDFNPIVKSSRKILPGLLLIAGGAVLVLGFIGHYLPASRSSELVFMGKDVYLNKTEAAMNNSYAAANQWAATGDQGALNGAVSAWTYASIYADSAVYFSTLATEIYPADLGGWYALGSAHLTRYMVMKPPVLALQSALETTGLEPGYTEQELNAELFAGMAAYDSLVARAPNYAEVHNNLALGYSNMGETEKSLEELYYSYLIHGHRRDDYFEQVLSVLPMTRGSVPGAALVFHHHMVELAERDPEQRIQEQISSVDRLLSHIFASQPGNVDTLKTLFVQIAGTELTGSMHDAVLQSIERGGGGVPFALWSTGELTQLQGMDLLSELQNLMVDACFTGSIFQENLPAEREFYTIAADAFLAEGMSAEAFDAVLRIYLHQIALDISLDETYTLIQSDRFKDHVADSVKTRLDLVRNAIGGSRTAMRNGQEMPWAEGSLPDLISGILQNEQSTDSLNSQWYEMELELTFMMISSYWWEYNIFAYSQNQYLLERVFHCRDMIRHLRPDAWQSVCVGVLDRVIQRIRPFTGGLNIPTLELLRDDLASGAERAIQ